MRKSPAMDKAAEYIKENKNATADDLIKIGVSRATAFKAIKQNKELGRASVSEIPDRLRKLPRLILEGFPVKELKDAKKNEIVWNGKVYVGYCPCCGEKTNLFKRSINRLVSYSGVCSKCNITVAISKA